MTAKSLGQQLVVEVFDWDMVGEDDFLGRVALCVDQVETGDSGAATAARWHPLEPKPPPPAEISGTITLRCFFDANQRKSLLLHVVSGADIPAADMNGLSDPYVIARLIRRGTEDDTERRAYKDRVTGLQIQVSLPTTTQPDVAASR